MNSATVEDFKAQIVDTAGSWFALPALNFIQGSLSLAALSSSPGLLFSVIIIAISRVFMFILSSCNHGAELVRVYTGLFNGLINLVAYFYMIYAAGQWIVRRISSGKLTHKRVVAAAPKGAQLNAKMNDVGNKNGTEQGVVGLCYTNGVFDHDKAAKYIEDIDQAVQMNTVLNHLMNPDLQKSLKGIRADTPIREFQTTFNTIKKKTSELAGL